MMICPKCNKEFITTNSTKKFCSSYCRRTYYRQKYKVFNFAPNVNAGTKGAISELLVCADLLIKGFNIFRASSPSCPCDLVAINNGKPYRVEVKTITGCLKTYIPPNLDLEKFDVLALVYSDEIKYWRYESDKWENVFTEADEHKIKGFNGTSQSPMEGIEENEEVNVP